MWRHGFDPSSLLVVTEILLLISRIFDFAFLMKSKPWKNALYPNSYFKGFSDQVSTKLRYASKLCYNRVDVTQRFFSFCDQPQQIVHDYWEGNCRLFLALFGWPINLRNILNNVIYGHKGTNIVIILSLAPVTIRFRANFWRYFFQDEHFVSRLLTVIEESSQL